MELVKRNGTKEKVDFSKIQKRLEELSYGLNVDLDAISQKAIATLYDGVSTKIVDEHLATISVNHSVHPDYNILAGRICSSSLHKETALKQFTRDKEEKLEKLLLSKNSIKEDHPLLEKFYLAVYEDPKRIKKIKDHVSGAKPLTKEELHEAVKVPRFYYTIKTMHSEGIVNDEVLAFVEKYREKLEKHIAYKRDFLFDYFGFKTIERAYLLKKHYKEKETILVDIVDENGEPTGEKETRVVTVNKFNIIERPQDMFMRVAIGILRRETDKPLERILELYDLMSEHYYTHATPTLFNSGTKREQNSSCFLILNEGDSIEEIFDTYKEQALISKNSGGIGVAVSNIRAKGSIIKGTNGTSKGILPFLKILNELARGIDQGGKRKGSISVYLEPWHADVEDFIRLKRNDGKDEERTRDLFLALWMPNLFYERVKQGKMWSLFSPDSAPGLMDVYGEEFESLYKKYEEEGRAIKVIDPREFMKDIFENQIETGVPYILNKDQANQKSNQKNLGTIKSSNLCITGSQRVVSSDGYLTAKELYLLNKELVLFNGQEPVKSSKMNLIATNEDVYKVILENGMELDATAYHGFPKVINNRIVRTELKDLVKGDEIAIQTKKGLFGTKNMEKEAYLLGVYQSDVTQSGNSIHLDIWENDFDLCNKIESYVKELEQHYKYKKRYMNKGSVVKECTSISSVKKQRLTTDFFKKILHFEKGTIPQWIWESDERTQLAYLDGLLLADGTVSKSKSKGQPIQLSYSDINKSFLKELQLIFNNLGLQSSIHVLSNEGEHLLPDGKGGMKYYKSKKCYRLVVGNKNDCLTIEKNTQFLSRKKINIENRFYRDNTKKSFKIKEIIYVGKEDVYCPTIKNDEHIFISQGMKTFNCTEIMEFTSKDESAVCNLASVCLPKFIKEDRTFDHKKLHEITRKVVYNLNAVIDINYYVNDKTKKSNMRHRPIGLGVQGLADVFNIMRIPYTSKEAQQVNEEIFETLYHAALTESIEMAKKFGHYESMLENGGAPISKGILQFDMWNKKPESGRYNETKDGILSWDDIRVAVKKYGVRNSLLLAPMPTASTSQIFNNYESFEPITENLYKRETLSGEFLVANKHLIKHLEELGIWGDEVRDYLVENNGSIQGLKFIPEEIRDVYKTVWELKLFPQIKMAADRGAFICQSQSLNLHIENPSMELMKNYYMKAYEYGLKTASYYFKTTAKGKNQTVTTSSKKTNNPVEEKQDDDCLVCGS